MFGWYGLVSAFHVWWISIAKWVGPKWPNLLARVLRGPSRVRCGDFRVQAPPPQERGAHHPDEMIWKQQTLRVTSFNCCFSQRPAFLRFSRTIFVRWLEWWNYKKLSNYNYTLKSHPIWRDDFKAGITFISKTIMFGSSMLLFRGVIPSMCGIFTYMCLIFLVSIW